MVGAYLITYLWFVLSCFASWVYIALFCLIAEILFVDYGACLCVVGTCFGGSLKVVCCLAD